MCIYIYVDIYRYVMYHIIIHYFQLLAGLLLRLVCPVLLWILCDGEERNRQDQQNGQQ